MPLPDFSTDPTPLLERRDGVYADDLLITAVSHLDLFTRLARNPCDLPNLCLGLDLAARPAEVMLTLFTALGLVQRNGPTYGLTTLAREHLVADAPGSLAPYFASLKDRPICQDILAVLQTGRPFGWGSQRNAENWHGAMERADFAEAFITAMDARGAYLAPRLAQALPDSGAPQPGACSEAGVNVNAKSQSRQGAKSQSRQGAKSQSRQGAKSQSRQGTKSQRKPCALAALHPCVKSAPCLTKSFAGECAPPASALPGSKAPGGCPPASRSRCLPPSTPR